jgi:hypothetical protein
MSAVQRSSRKEATPEPLPEGLARVPVRRLVVLSPTIRFVLSPGDRVLVLPGDTILPGTPLAERTPDATLVEVGSLVRPAPRDAIVNSEGGNAGGSAPAPPAAGAEPVGPIWRESGDGQAPAGESQGAVGAAAGESNKVEPAAAQGGVERRRSPVPGKWWVGGADRRAQGRQRGQSRRIGGTLLYEMNGRWLAAAGERHEIVESPVAGVVTEARNGVAIAVTVSGVAIPGAIGEGTASRGYMDVPPLVDGELAARALDVGRSGAIVVAGTRVSAEALIRARAMSIRGVVAGSVGQAELRDLAASDARQRAGMSQPPPFAVLALEGYLRRPIASPVLALMAALTGKDVAIVVDPPLLVFEMAGVTLPQIPPDWVRVQSGPLAGREGNWLGPAGLHRFRSGIHLEAAHVRLGADLEPTVVALNDLERFVL